LAGRVVLRLYSVLREIAGTSRVEAEPLEGETVGQLVDRVLGRAVSRLRERGIPVIVLGEDGRRVDPTEEAVAHGVLHVMPPPSGGGATVRSGLLGPGDDPWRVLSESLEELSRDAREGVTGALVVFVGVVRRDNKGHKVVRLVYEAAGSLAERKLRELAEEYASRPGITGVAAYHYTGERRPGEVTMIVAVAGRGRSETLPALAELVDRIKHEVPIWKREEREDGTVYILGDREESADSLLR